MFLFLFFCQMFFNAQPISFVFWPINWMTAIDCVNVVMDWNRLWSVEFDSFRCLTWWIWILLNLLKWWINWWKTIIKWLSTFFNPLLNCGRRELMMMTKWLTSIIKPEFWPISVSNREGPKWESTKEISLIYQEEGKVRKGKGEEERRKRKKNDKERNKQTSKQTITRSSGI